MSIDPVHLESKLSAVNTHYSEYLNSGERVDMIVWKNVLSRDYEAAVVNGMVDSDLERMSDRIETRIKERDGIKRCPICEELLEHEHVHENEGVVVTPIRT